MQLTILGGSSASPNTGMGCSGYLIVSGDTHLLIDPGPGTLQELRRHTDFRTLDAVIISHMHLDHCLDLLAMRHSLAYNPTPAPAPVPVWLPPGGSGHLARAVAPFDECDRPGRFDATICINEYDPDQSLSIGELAVSFTPTVHDLPTWAMRFTNAAGQSIGYTADTGPSADLAAFFHNVDLLIAESTLQDPAKGTPESRGSLTAGEAGCLATAANAGRLVLTHYWEEHDLDAKMEAAANSFAGSIQLSRRGFTIIW